MKKVAITNVHVTSTRGPDKQAGSGTVGFSDGKTYRYIRLPEQVGGGFSFFTDRRRGHTHESLSFTSEARAQALATHLAELEAGT